MEGTTAVIGKKINDIHVLYQKPKCKNKNDVV
jgi:hypothetical protein